MNQVKAALYARVSTEEQAKEGYSIAAQISEIRKYAEQNGLEIVDEYVDESIWRDRPGKQTSRPIDLGHQQR